MKHETPIYKGFARGFSSRDTHQDSHPVTHHQGESEVNSNELRPHSSVVQVTNWVSMVRVFLFVDLFFAFEHKSSGDVVTGIGPEVVEF